MPRAHASAVIPAPVDGLWHLVRDFGAHHSWIHNATATTLTGAPTEVGVLRTIDYADGTALSERLVALDDVDHLLRYALPDPHEPLASLVGTIRLLPVTAADATYIERYVDFEIADGSDPEIFRARSAGLLATSLALLADEAKVVG